MDPRRAAIVTFQPGQVRARTPTTAVQYLDLSGLFADADERDFYVKVVCTVDLYAVPVASITPTVAPTPELVDDDSPGVMDFVPAKTPEPFVITRANPVLAFSGAGGVMRVRRTSPSE